MSDENKTGVASTGNGPIDGSSAQSADNSTVETLKAELEKSKNEFLYLRAEFENFRRNSIKERSDLIKYGTERIVVDLLGVLDNFERALSVKATPETLATYVKGIEITAQELRALLQKFGVAEVVCEKAPFDPAIHEALSSEESNEVPVGHITKVFRKPYKLYDKLIRPGQVIVAKAPAGK